MEINSILTKTILQFSIVDVMLYSLLIFIGGYWLNRHQLRKLRRKMLRLEDEMLQQDAEFLKKDERSGDVI